MGTLLLEEDSDMPKFTTLAHLRWTRREADALAATHGLTDVRLAHDDRGFSITECTADADPLPAVTAHLQAVVLEQRRRWAVKRGGQRVVSLRSVAKRGGPPAGTQAGEAGPADSRHVASKPGVCAAVRQWAEEHPDATVRDAIAAFPDANRTTVRIQFRQVHPAQH